MNQLEKAAYDQFRTNFTFKDIYSMLWSNSDDSRNWPKQNAQPRKRKKGKGNKTAGRRHVVLGKWHEIKMTMWENYKYQFQLEFEDND